MWNVQANTQRLERSLSWPAPATELGASPIPQRRESTCPPPTEVVPREQLHLPPLPHHTHFILTRDAGHIHYQPSSPVQWQAAISVYSLTIATKCIQAVSACMGEDMVMLDVR